MISSYFQQIRNPYLNDLPIDEDIEQIEPVVIFSEEQEFSKLDPFSDTLSFLNVKLQQSVNSLR